MTDFVGTVSFWLLVMIGVVSAVPFDLRKGCRSLSLYLPLAALALWATNELALRMAIPLVNVPIRVDLIITLPLVAFIVAMGVTRLTLVWYLAKAKRSTKDTSQMTGRKQQVLGVLVFGAAAMAWFCSIWW
jgi:hypothetical protein